MTVIGKRISETRKLKGLTQEELAEKSKINLRTIQRIEKEDNIPRGKTLNMICEALQIDSSEFAKDQRLTKFETDFINGFLIIGYSFAVIAIFYFLTIHQQSNTNSRLGAFLLSFFLPFFVTFMTLKMDKIERLIKFSIGPIIYLILLLVSKGFAYGFILGFLPCLAIYISILYFGDEIIKSRSYNK